MELLLFIGRSLVLAIVVTAVSTSLAGLTDTFTAFAEHRFDTLQPGGSTYEMLHGVPTMFLMTWAAVIALLGAEAMLDKWCGNDDANGLY